MLSLSSSRCTGALGGAERAALPDARLVGRAVGGDAGDDAALVDVEVREAAGGGVPCVLHKGLTRESLGMTVVHRDET